MREKLTRSCRGLVACLRDDLFSAAAKRDAIAIAIALSIPIAPSLAGTFLRAGAYA